LCSKSPCSSRYYVTSLSLTGNQLGGIPPEISRLTALIDFSFSDNSVKSIPSQLASLTCLTELSFIDNAITAIPPELGLLKNLKKMHTDNNDIKSPPREILNKGTSEILSFLRRVLEARERGNLELAFLDLVSFPLENLGVPNLTTLQLSDNLLEKLSNDIGTLQSLTSLSVQNNRLASFPPSMRNVTSLTFLQVCVCVCLRACLRACVCVPVRDMCASVYMFVPCRSHSFSSTATSSRCSLP